MKIPAFLLCIFPLAGLTSCASIVNGTTQSVAVSTTDNVGTPLESAQCDLTNKRGSWSVTTPETVIVHRSFSALQVKCTKNGYEEADQKVKSVTSEAFAGNIIAGGLVGEAVDAEDGSAFDYPENITISMNPVPAAVQATAPPAGSTQPAPVATN
jgi:hypothetical protein